MLLSATENCHKCQQPSRSMRLMALAVAASMGASASSAIAATEPDGQPRLVVGIMVEDLRSEYISLLKDHFAPGGFKRLLSDGAVISSADYGTPVDAAAATAIIYTGASPAYNGVPAATVFDTSTLQPVPIMASQPVGASVKAQAMSPEALAMTTITDEVRIAGGGVTYAYAIAPDAAQALVMASHAGNSGIWINSANDKWTTSSFYKEAPSTLAARNRLKPLRARIDTMIWTPLYGKEAYAMLPEHVKLYPFRYIYRAAGPQKMEQFMASPKVNDEVTDFAIENIKALKLGSHSGTDMMSVAYTLKPYDYGKAADNRYEILDQYYRLDRNLASLLAEVDKSVGLGNAIVFVAGTPASPQAKRDDEQWMLPYGEFSVRKAMSLLNLYLIAIHGNGDWTLGYHDNQYYLNHKLIEERGLSLEAVRKDCARFLERMSGIARAYSLDEIIDSRGADVAAIKRNTHMDYAGDVRVFVMPGWQIIDDFNLPSDRQRTNQVVRASAATAPVFIMAPGVAPQTIGSAVDARAIAPTITSLLRIRSPNGASEAPLHLSTSASNK